MVDPRIYRACLMFVAFAVIAFGFSLQNRPAANTSSLSTGAYFSDVQAQMRSLAKAYPNRAPGSQGDAHLAGVVAGRLGKEGFRVQTDYFNANTALGSRQLETVVGTRVGLGSGTVVVVSHRDATGKNAVADMSGTAELIALARAVESQTTLNRTVMLVSTSGQVGAAGATKLADSLSGQPVDAVIVLGNVGGSSVRQPLVVPWSDSDDVAPTTLRDTLAAYVTAQTRLPVSGASFVGQIARLGFPFTITEQGPFAARGIPAVLLSESGDRLTAANASVTAGSAAARTTGFGTALLQTVDALANGPSVGAPRPYLVLSGKVVPEWAMRLLVLALLIPVAATTVDALARTRRRGHSLSRWIVWVLSGAVPFFVGVLGLIIANVVGALSATPPGAVGAGGVPLTAADVVVLVVVLALVVLAFVFLRPLCLRLVTDMGEATRPETPAADAAAVSLSVVMCALVLIVWLLNPFAALLLTPALHVWMWLAAPTLRARRWAMLLVALAAIIPIGLVLAYYAQLLGLSPVGLLWSLTLMVAGGAMPIMTAVYWSVALGCLLSAIVLSRLSAKAASVSVDNPAPVTVRGPVTYAGPGSLGGTESALRR